MSDKCQHNNHTHFMIWMFIWWLMVNSCTDGSCAGSQTKNEVRQLQWQVQQLQQQCNSKK